MDKETERLFYMAASSISSMDFSEYIEEIKNMNAKVYDQLNKIEKNKWVICFDQIPTFGYSASSVAESSNSWLKLERRCSYYDFILQFRSKVAKKQQKKRDHILHMFIEYFKDE